MKISICEFFRPSGCETIESLYNKIMNFRNSVTKNEFKKI